MLSSVDHVFILGLGVSGLATAHFFQAQGTRVIVWDDRASKRQEALDEGFAIAAGPAWEEGFWYVVISPGILEHRLTEFRPYCAEGKGLITCDLGIFLILFPQAQVLGVTGTNGKSTTCSLISHILTARHITHQLAGNIGIPIFQAAKHHTPDTWYILEWSSYQLELCSEHPWHIHVGGILNLTPHHLERHHDMQRYGSIKGQLLTHSTHAVVDYSGPYIDYVITQDTSHPRMTYIGASPAAVLDKSIRYDHEGIHDGAISLILAWMPQWRAPAFRQNCTMAYALLKHIPEALAYFLEDIATFKPLEHRQEPCLIMPHVQCVNDSKATTPEAALHALKAYSAPILWIAGGVVQQDDLEILTEGLNAVAEAFLYGQAAERFAQFLHSQNIACSTYLTLESATQAAWEKSKHHASSVILCAPACPSFDAFRDFMERGRAFKTYVHHLSNTPNGASL